MTNSRGGNWRFVKKKQWREIKIKNKDDIKQRKKLKTKTKNKWGNFCCLFRRASESLITFDANGTHQHTHTLTHDTTIKIAVEPTTDGAVVCGHRLHSPYKQEQQQQQEKEEEARQRVAGAHHRYRLRPAAGKLEQLGNKKRIINSNFRLFVKSTNQQPQLRQVSKKNEPVANVPWCCPTRPRRNIKFQFNRFRSFQPLKYSPSLFCFFF